MRLGLERLTRILDLVSGSRVSPTLGFCFQAQLNGSVWLVIRGGGRICSFRCQPVVGSSLKFLIVVTGWAVSKRLLVSWKG